MSEATTFLETCREKLRHAQSLLDATIKATPSLQNTAEPANALAIDLDWVGSMASLYQSVHPDADVRGAAETAEQELSRFTTELSLNRAYYDAVNAIPEAGLDATAKRWRAHTLRDFRRSGVDKDEKTRARIRELNEELTTISQEFSKAIREDVRHIAITSEKDLAGLPADYIAKIKARTPMQVTTDYPDLVPFMTYAESVDLRKQLYIANRQRGFPANLKVLDRMIRARHELAQLLGYANWADYVTETRMIKSGGEAQKFIDRISTLSAEPAKKDYAALKDGQHVDEWERAYLEEKVARAKFNFSAQEVRPYFEYSRVKEGVLRTCEKIFACTFRRVDEKAWHADVETYDVLVGAQVAGRFQLDMHPRPDKYKHAAQFTRQSGVRDVQIPVGVLVCNFPDPKSGDALMEHSDVVTFFHEFGHLMHHIFGGHQHWLRMSGVATEWDFVEAPSQMLEEWAWDYEVLSSFAKHHKTGEVLPADLAKRMRAADEFGKAIQARVQMFYAAVSLAMFSRDPASLPKRSDGLIDSTAVIAELQNKYSPFNYVPDTHFQLSFGHLDGYSAGYYTYMWSLVIAKDLFSAFEKNGLMDRRTAERYRDEILAQGGADDAAKLVEHFLGRPYQFDAFERWLSR